MSSPELALTKETYQSRIKGIIFDLSEVYLRGLLGTEDYLNATYDLNATNADFHCQEMPLFFHGQITEDEYWRALLQKTKWTLTIEELKEAVRNNFREIEGTRQIIENLKQRGYRLGLLSVHSREWIEYCEAKFDYHCLFDKTMYSYQVGISKPDVQAYQLIAIQLGLEPEQLIFIDDSEKNVIAAQEAGMVGLVFTHASTLTKELIALGIQLSEDQ